MRNVEKKQATAKFSSSIESLCGKPFIITLWVYSRIWNKLCVIVVIITKLFIKVGRNKLGASARRHKLSTAPKICDGQQLPTRISSSVSDYVASAVYSQPQLQTKIINNCILASTHKEFVPVANAHIHTTLTAIFQANLDQTIARWFCSETEESLSISGVLHAGCNSCQPRNRQSRNTERNLTRSTSS